MKIIILARGFQPITNGEMFWMNNDIVIIEFSFCMMRRIKQIKKENDISQGR